MTLDASEGGKVIIKQKCASLRVIIFGAKKSTVDEPGNIIVPVYCPAQGGGKPRPYVGFMSGQSLAVAPLPCRWFISRKSPLSVV